MIDSKKVLNNIINTTSPKSIVGQMASLYKKIDDDLIKIKKPICEKNCHKCCSDVFFISQNEFCIILYYLEKYKDVNYVTNKIRYSQKN